MPPVLAFLHTARPNVDVFQRLMSELAPEVSTRHELVADVLSGAVASGRVTDEMRAGTEDAVRRLIAEGANAVVCTCSTIGGVAEATAVTSPAWVMRIDRPMAEAAVASGRRVLVAAALPSTLGPTLALLQQVAAAADRAIEVVEVLCDQAWSHFARGDREAYAIEIARAVTAVAQPSDIVVLAQASMAPAAALIEARGITVLSSPALGVRAALKLLQSTGAN
ncbi:MAG: hypothetical protein ABI051_07375 [Vicinamibacterales bacterium]